MSKGETREGRREGEKSRYNRTGKIQNNGLLLGMRVQV
jgi:hypothetical protein